MAADPQHLLAKETSAQAPGAVVGAAAPSTGGVAELGTGVWMWWKGFLVASAAAALMACLHIWPDMDMLLAVSDALSAGVWVSAAVASVAIAGRELQYKCPKFSEVSIENAEIMENSPEKRRFCIQNGHSFCNLRYIVGAKRVPAWLGGCR